MLCCVKVVLSCVVLRLYVLCCLVLRVSCVEAVLRL